MYSKKIKKIVLSIIFFVIIILQIPVFAENDEEFDFKNLGEFLTDVRSRNK